MAAKNSPALGPREYLITIWIPCGVGSMTCDRTSTPFVVSRLAAS